MQYWLKISFHHRPPSYGLLSFPVPYFIHFCSHCGTLAGTRQVGLRSVDLFQYKLLLWSWLKWHWCTDYLLWRSVLMHHLIMPPLPACVRLSVVGFHTFLKLWWASVRQRLLNSRGTMDGSYRHWHLHHLLTPAPHTPPTAPNSLRHITLLSGLDSVQSN